MTRYIFKPTAFHNAIGHRSPALTISDGDTVVTETLEAWGFAADGRQLAGPPNPMTGPFFVGDAEPGDALEISIDRMTPNRGDGWTFAPVALNVVDPAMAANYRSAHDRSGPSTAARRSASR